MDDRNYERIESRIDVLILILVELLARHENVKGSSNFDDIKEKCASLLVGGGMSQEKAGKLLSMQKKRVTRAAKAKKI